MRIQFFSSYYAPERSGNAPYVTGLAEFLAQEGHEVTVATGFPHYPMWRLEGHTPLSLRERTNGVDLLRRRHYVPSKQTAARRGAYELSLLAAGATAIPLRRRPDVVVAVMPTLSAGLLGAATASSTRSPLVVLLQDLQGLGAQESGIQSGRSVAGIVSSLESRVLRRARCVGVIAEDFRPHVIAAGVAPERVRRVRNWPVYAQPLTSPAVTREQLGWQPADVVCLHAGNMGRKQGLDNVLHAAARLEDMPAMRIVLAGDGNDRRRLEREAQALGLRNVSFLQPRPSDGSWEALLAAADVLLLNQRASVGAMSLPSKLATYLAAGRAVVGAVGPESEAAREIEAAGAGVVVAPDDPDALARALAGLASTDAAAMGASARRYAETVLAKERALAEIRDVLIAVGSQVPARGVSPAAAARS